MEAKELLIEYSQKFFSKNFNKIKYDLTDSNLPDDKEGFLNDIKNVQDAIWSLCELSSWGMDKDYFLSIKLKDSEKPFNEDDLILKIYEKYIFIGVNGETRDYTYKYVEPKIREVLYFE